VLARYFALASGILFSLAAVGGFVPVVTPPAPPDAPPLLVSANYGYLLGLFPVNLAHNLVHATIGVLGFVAARSPRASRTFARGLAVWLGAFTLMGMVPALHTAFGLLPLHGHDVWLHGIETIAAAYVGFFSLSSDRLPDPG
jgi:hypothetical protein